MKERTVVVFDVYKTLLDITVNEDNLKAYTIIAQWLADRGVRIAPEEIYARFKKITSDQLKHCGELHPDIDIGSVFTQLVNDAAKTHKDHFIEDLSWLFRKQTTTSLVMYPQVSQVLKRLYGKVRLAIVSNSQRLFTMPELVGFDIAKYFEYILFSSDVKACKPNPVIFHKLVKDLKIEPHNGLFVGDDLHNDIAAAQKMGMKTVWINHARNDGSVPRRQFPCPNAEVHMGNYRDLSSIVLSLAS